MDSTKDTLSRSFTRKVKTLLSYYPARHLLIQTLTRELERSRLEVEGIQRGVQYQRTKASPTFRISDPTFEAVERAQHQAELRIVRLSKELERLLAEQQLLEALMNRLDANSRAMIYARYMDKHTWNQMARTFHFSQRHCMRLVEASMRKLCSALKDGMDKPSS